MSNFDEQLKKQLEELRLQAESVRLSLRSTRPGCSCSEQGCCSHHAIAWNALLDVDATLQGAIRTLELYAWQEGEGERPAWYSAEEAEAWGPGRDEELERLLDDVDISALDGLEGLLDDPDNS